jgi:putrescine aminotransferase
MLVIGGQPKGDSVMEERRTRLWHPFANMAAVAHDEFVIDRGDGVWVWDQEGRRYLDATAGLWFCNVGHGRGEIASAAGDQMRRLAAYSMFGSYANKPALELAERVSAMSPIADSAVFFTNSGSEAVDTAAKLVRRYWNLVGQPDRYLLVTRESAYHGMNGFGTSLAGIPANASGYGELLPGVVHVPRDDPQALAALCEQRGSQIAAFFAETVVGAGGVYPPVAGYWDEIERICRAHDILLVIDEVITGFGRLGYQFASERFDVQPDLVTFAKGVTSGYAPLGGVICASRVQEPFWKGEGSLFRHGYTYSGHATSCAVALANLDVLERHSLVQRVRALEPHFADILGRLQGHPGIAAVRCTGLLAAVELDRALLEARPDAAERAVASMRERGVLTRTLVGHSLQISPAFVITDAEINVIADAVRDAVDAAMADSGAVSSRS